MAELKPKAQYGVPPVEDDESFTTKRADGDGGLRQRLSAVPQLDLSRWRFAATVAVSLGVLIAILAIFRRGVVIERDVLDDLGSSKNADGKIETYQAVNGFITAAVGMIMESYFEVFVIVASIFLTNVRWYPGDEPRSGGNRFKRLCLWAFPPFTMFILNVAITATFVSHKTTGVVRVFLKDDLVTTTALSVKTLNATTAANLTTLGNKQSVLDTILRGAVRRQVAPFEMLADSPCVLTNITGLDDQSSGTLDLPSVKEVRSTAVVYGFPTQEWNLDAMPFGLEPEHTVVFKLGLINGSANVLADQFAAFQKASGVSWLTTYELLLQGKLLFERSVSDSNVSASYPCVWVDNQVIQPADAKGLDSASSDGSDAGSAETSTPKPTTKAPASTTKPNPTTKAPTTSKPSRRSRFLQAATDASSSEDLEGSDSSGEEDLSQYMDLYEDGPYKGMRRCYGAVSSLQYLANYTSEKTHNINDFVGEMVQGFIDTIPQVAPEDMDFTMSTYQISPLIKLTTMTLDMPYFNASYRNTKEYCDGDELNAALTAALSNDTSDEDLESLRQILCNQANCPYLEPRSACGHSNCIFLDKSGTIPFKKQLQLTPYLKNCSTANLKYNADYLNYLPSGCVPQEDSMFLYGLGSYMAGDAFYYGGNDSVPFISNPQRHVVLTFAKLEWQLEDLSKKFDAACGVNTTTSTSQCMGLVHNLENVTVPAVNLTGAKDKYLRMLVVGKDTLPAERMEKDYRNPVQLLSLNTRPFYYPRDGAYYEWEYVNKKHFNESDWPVTANGKGGLSATKCSPLIDSYIAQVEENHFFMDHPEQPLYTSALFYLFQDAAVKTVKVGKNVTTGAEVLELSVVGTTSLKGDLEKHVIKFSVPKLSLISTFLGMGLLLVLVVLVLVCPTERLKMSEETSVAVQYAQLLQHDQYPSEVFERSLLLPSGEKVPMDDYGVDSATVHFKRDEDKKVFL